jgi:hypothetical protein
MFRGRKVTGPGEMPPGERLYTASQLDTAAHFGTFGRLGLLVLFSSFSLRQAGASFVVFFWGCPSPAVLYIAARHGATGLLRSRVCNGFRLCFPLHASSTFHQACIYRARLDFPRVDCWLSLFEPDNSHQQT